METKATFIFLTNNNGIISVDDFSKISINGTEVSLFSKNNYTDHIIGMYESRREAEAVVDHIANLLLKINDITNENVGIFGLIIIDCRAAKIKKK